MVESSQRTLIMERLWLDDPWRSKRVWCQWEEQLHESSVCTQRFYLRQNSPAAQKIKSPHKKVPCMLQTTSNKCHQWRFWGQLEQVQSAVLRVICISVSEKSLKGILYPGSFCNDRIQLQNWGTDRDLTLSGVIFCHSALICAGQEGEISCLNISQWGREKNPFFTRG